MSDVWENMTENTEKDNRVTQRSLRCCKWQAPVRLWQGFKSFFWHLFSCFRSRSSGELWKYLIRHSLWSHQAGGAWRFAGSWVCSGTCPRPDRWSSAALDCPTRWALCRRTDARFCPKEKETGFYTQLWLNLNVHVAAKSFPSSLNGKC